jgi:hypothetical protein
MGDYALPSIYERCCWKKDEVYLHSLLERCAEGLAAATQYGAGNWSELIKEIYRVINVQED